MKNILFIDIETVSCQPDYRALSLPMQELWDKKVNSLYGRLQEELDPSALFFKQAAIYAEFGKVIVIGLGAIHQDEEGTLSMQVKALKHDDEKKLLNQFADILNQKFYQSGVQLCAHNGKEFDFPYLCRRMLIQGIKLPMLLNVMGKKPWELPYLDTMEMWKFGDRKSFTSLHLLATIFGITSSKEDMQGSQVNEFYHHHQDLDRIARYCMQDVAVLGQLFCKLQGWPTLCKEQITLRPLQ